MPKNKMSDLRDHLFATLEQLRDEEKPMEIKRGVAVAMVAQQIIESAKAELRFQQLMGNTDEVIPFFDGDKSRQIEAAKVTKSLGR